MKKNYIYCVVTVEKENNQFSFVKSYDEWTNLYHEFSKIPNITHANVFTTKKMANEVCDLQNKKFNQDSDSDYKIVDLSVAKELYDNDKVVYALPSNIKLEDVINGVREDVELFEISHKVYGDRWFKEIVSDYEYFSCDEENGEDVVFYVNIKEKQ